jgi:signal peptidase I
MRAVRAGPSFRGVLVLEIAPVPHRATSGEWRRLALGLLVLTPVVLLVLLPAVLGLQRYVVTDQSMDGSLGRGSVVLAREVPTADLEVGDVISFRAPEGGSDERVTRRIVAIEDGVATTQADTTGSQDPWTVPLTRSSYARVWLGVPYLGYPFVMEGGWVLLAAVALAAFVLALATGRRAPLKVVGQTRTHLPVG